MANNDGNVLLTNCRLGYPKLWRAESIKNDNESKPRFGCQLYLPKANVKERKALEAEIERLTAAKFKGVKVKKADLFIKDGDDPEISDENTAGCWIVSANRAESQGRPQVVDRGRNPLTPDDGKPYAGCYVNALISVFVPANWKKICASLEVVQFVKDGEPFGAPRVDVAEVMPDLADDESDGLDDDI